MLCLYPQDNDFQMLETLQEQFLFFLIMMFLPSLWVNQIGPNSMGEINITNTLWFNFHSFPLQIVSAPVT
jgi:hypothetical protein